MNRYAALILFAMVFGWSTLAAAHPHILRLSDRTEVSFEQMIHDLKQARVVFIGELHNNPGHHQAQLTIIDALYKSGENIAVGLEMFRKENQQALDLWSEDQMPERRFVEVFDRNWSMWPQYRNIFLYAREFRIPMVGLNIPEDVSRQVAAEGIDSLTKQQNRAGDKVVCTVDPIYMNFIRRAMGGHGGHGESFVHFCEAQLLWDVAMARHLSEYLEGHPTMNAVVLAGSGHSWKYGMPSRLASDITPIKVVLPEIPGRLNRVNVTADDADYLWLDEGDGSWSAPDRFNGPVRSSP